MIYFLSDLHLGASYLPRRETEARAVRFLEQIAADAEELYLLGDVLDYWYEYRTVVPRGFVRFFGALARLADAGVKITWLTGNHDIWLFDYLRDEIGIRVVDGSITPVIAGHKFYLAHGDRLGSEPAGFRFIQRLFRNKTCQRLFASVHPRWTVPLGFGWSSRNRAYSPDSAAELTPDMRQRILDWAETYSQEHPDIDYILLGHHHVALDHRLSTGCRLLILGEWIYHSTYAAFDKKNIILSEFKEQNTRFNIY